MRVVVWSRGVLVNISSGAARKAFFGWSMYCASKAAVDRMSEAIALEEESTLTAVYSVAPGVVDTGMQAAIRSKTEAELRDVERFRQMLEVGTLKSPDETAAQFCSSYSTGQRRACRSAWTYGSERLRSEPRPCRFESRKRCC